MFAQTTGRIVGTVLDKATGEPLPSAAVTIVGTFYQTLTDFDGKFVLNDIKPGTYSVKFQFIGYQPMQFNDIKIGVGKTVKLDAKLSEQSEMLQAVTVVGRKNQVDLEHLISKIMPLRGFLFSANNLLIDFATSSPVLSWN